MNEYVHGSNICRAFILQSDDVYCIIVFLFSSCLERTKNEGKKNGENERKKQENGKNLDLLDACFGRRKGRERERERERKIIRT